MERCIVSVGVGSWHPEGIGRLGRSLDQVGYTGARKFWINEYPPGSPSHQEVPYAFKPYAFEAARAAGHRLVLWCDAAVWAARDIVPMFDYIREHGHYFQHGGWNTGQWCKDEALEPLGLTRESAFEVPHMMACIMGIDFENDRSVQFFDQWMAHAKDGITFPGPWTNENQQCSPDTRVLGHRHDQTVASVVSHRLGMEWVGTQEDYKLIYHGDGVVLGPNACFTSRGGSGVMYPVTLG